MTEMTHLHRRDPFWKAWALDVTFWREGEAVFHWCPIAENGDIVVGMTVISGVQAPGPMYAIIHEDGQEAVESWMANHASVLASLSAANTGVHAEP